MGATKESALKSLVVPGGALLFLAAVLGHSGWVTLAIPSLTFLYYCALLGGMLLAWRFHSSRIFFALLVLFLAMQGLGFFGGHGGGQLLESAGLKTAATLIPLDFVLIGLMHERGFTISSTAPVLL